MHVDKAALVQLPHSFSGEAGRAGKADVPAPVPIDEEPSVIEPRLGHDDRRERIRHKAWRKPVSTADIVVPSPIRNHLPIRHRAHRLWHKIPVARVHCIPLTRIREDVSMSCEHVVERAVPQRLRDVVPVCEMHAAPERQIALHVVDSRVSFDMLGAESDRDGYRRGVDQGGIDVDRRRVWHRCTNLMLQPRVTRRRAADHERQTEKARREPIEAESYLAHLPRQALGGTDLR